MSRVGSHPLVGLIEKNLEEQYLQALTYAIHYRSGWERAQQAYQQLHAFKVALAKETQPEEQATREVRERQAA